MVRGSEFMVWSLESEKACRDVDLSRFNFRVRVLSPVETHGRASLHVVRFTGNSHLTRDVDEA